MRKIVARLPYYNESRWKDRASAILRMRNSPLTFRDLTEFLLERAQSENNPLYGNLKDFEKGVANRLKKEERKRKDEVISIYATQSGLRSPGTVLVKKDSV